MERQTRANATISSAGTAVRTLTGQKGFTYVEVAVVLMLLLLLIPMGMTFTFHLEQGIKETFWEQQLQMELSAFAMDVRDEIRACTRFRLAGDGALLMDTPAGETIRYRLDRHRIIRSVRAQGESGFKGTTILAHQVSRVRFSPDDAGVSLEISLQNGYGEQEAHYYFRGRAAGGNEG